MDGAPQVARSQAAKSRPADTHNRAMAGDHLDISFAITSLLPASGPSPLTESILLHGYHELVTKVSVKLVEQAS